MTNAVKGIIKSYERGILSYEEAMEELDKEGINCESAMLMLDGTISLALAPVRGAVGLVKDILDW
jgi:hypothetical protein